MNHQRPANRAYEDRFIQKHGESRGANRYRTDPDYRFRQNMLAAVKLARRRLAELEAESRADR